METTKRVLVYLFQGNSLLQCGKVLSAPDTFPCHQETSCWLSGLEQNRFVLSDRQFSGSSGRAHFAHQEIEPRPGGLSPEEIGTGGWMSESSSYCSRSIKRVLMTRRSKNLSLFPNLLQAGLRELQEETGLQLQDKISWSMLGLWESAFPPLLSCGLTRRHHIVTFLLVLSSETHLQLQKRLCPDEKEVSACVWLESQIVEHIVAAEDGAQDSGKSLGDLPETVGITEASCGALIQKDLDVTKFLNSAPKDGEDVERISTGTKYALRLWLDTLSQQNL
ncbi:hypothetical protein FKM82_016294 [Ascaphus truei]